jgi:hypothetical protein
MKLKLDYDEISPITGRKTVLVEEEEFSGDSVKLCMETGYQTYERLWKVENEEIIANLENQFPYQVVDSKFIDSNDNVWYKSFLISPNVLLYPDGKTWKVSFLIDLDPGNGVPIQVPTSENTFAIKFLDEATSSVYKETEFEDALFEFQRRITEKRLRDEN